MSPDDSDRLRYAPPDDELFSNTVLDLRLRVARIERALNFSDQIEPRAVPVTPDLDDYGNPWTERDLELWAEAAQYDGSDVGDC